jgi:hypothetical protein
MNADTFAEWYRRQGYRITRTQSSYWYNAGPRVLQAFPYHWLIKPEKEEFKQLFWKQEEIALRYSTPLVDAEGLISYHVTLKGPYKLENLRSQARNGIRRGLEHASIEPISFQRLASEGWELQFDTLKRQGRTSSMTQAEWERLCLSADGLPCFQAWGAQVDGVLAASLITTRIDDIFYVPFAQSHSRYLDLHVNNALFYRVCTDLLAQEGVQGIFFCLHSLDARDSVNEFKFRMGFTPQPVRQRVVFHPLLAPLTTGVTHAAVERLLKRNPDSYLLQKAEGMLRFSVKGKLPIALQPWPACLEKDKATLLEQIAAADGGFLQNQVVPVPGSSEDP